MDWRVTRWLEAVCLGWLLLGSVPLMAQSAGQQQAVEFALQRLAISPAIAQLDTVIGQTLQNLQHRADSALLPPQVKRIGDLLALHYAADRIQLATERGLLARLPSNSEQAVALLDDALVGRVANFDVSLEMRGAVEKFARFQQQLVIEDVAAERIALLRRLDKALQSSVIAATMQAELAVAADLMAAHFIVPVAVSDAALASQQQQRQRHLAKVLLALNLYSYRFMPDKELQRYVSLLEQDSIQTLLAASQQALYHSLLAARAAAVQQLTLTER